MDFYETLKVISRWTFGFNQIQDGHHSLATTQKWLDAAERMGRTATVRVRFGGLRILIVLFADDVVLLASSCRDFQTGEVQSWDENQNLQI